MTKEEYKKKRRHNRIIKAITKIALYIMMLELILSVSSAPWFYDHAILMIVIEFICFAWCELFCCVNGNKAFERLFK